MGERRWDRVPGKGLSTINKACVRNFSLLDGIDSTKLFVVLSARTGLYKVIWQLSK